MALQSANFPASAGKQILAVALHPMFALYCGVLAGVALVFDLLYLMIGGGFLMAAFYSLPTAAGLVACLVAAADELRLDRTATKAAISLAAVAGLTNTLYLGAVGGVLAVGPSDWGRAVCTVLLSAAAVASAAVAGHLTLHLAELAPRLRASGDPDRATVELSATTGSRTVIDQILARHEPDRTLVEHELERTLVEQELERTLVEQELDRTLVLQEPDRALTGVGDRREVT